MYIKSEPFDKSQAIDFMMRPLIDSEYPIEIIEGVKKKLMKWSNYEMLKLLRESTKLDVIRFSDDLFCFRYIMN